MTALARKLWRDLWHLRGQAITIALVVAAGIASFVTMRGTYASLQAARTTFYGEQRLGHVFASLERAPVHLAKTLQELPGVARVETRVVQPVMLPLPQITEPVRGSVVSLPERPQLNLIRLRDGRLPEADHPDEAVLLSSFAQAHGLRVGDRVPVVINGTLRRLLVVGLAVSPEYVMAMAAGSMAPEPDRFAVLWMTEDTLAAAFRMEGAFDDVAVELQPGASAASVIDALDRALAPYGGLGAYGRDRQPSNRMIDSELQQLSGMERIVPAIFLAVAALLVNLVLSRLVHLQQAEIATLKALGYSDRHVGRHFLALVMVVGGAGSVAGVALGSWLGDLTTGLYTRYFKFPDLGFHLDLPDASLAVAASLAAASVGAFAAVRRATRLPPAEAMRPPSPARYRRSILERAGVRATPAVQMVVRELQRRPLRTLSSAFAIAAATALSVVGGWYYDGIDALFYTQFHLLMREDAAVAFLKPRPERAVRELGHLPGVLAAEGLRAVPVRFRSGHRHRDAVVWGYPDATSMRGPRDAHGALMSLPPDGVVLTDVLAQILDVKVGDKVDIEVREGARDQRTMVVTGLLGESFGMAGHMRAEALDRLLHQEPQASVALLRTDPTLAPELDRRLKDIPAVLEVTKRARIVQRFREQSGEMITTMAFVISLFAATITIGVVYNNARVALSMRGRDLASLRVLGFTRGEISAVLVGEQIVQVLVAIVPGLVLGHALVRFLASTVDPETYRIPLILTTRSYAFAAAVTLVAAAVSALLVRRRLDRLDLVAVLKTRE